MPLNEEVEESEKQEFMMYLKVIFRIFLKGLRKFTYNFSLIRIKSGSLEHGAT
jgi:hypothetical protein